VNPSPVRAAAFISAFIFPLPSYFFVLCSLIADYSWLNALFLISADL